MIDKRTYERQCSLVTNFLELPLYRLKRKSFGSTFKRNIVSFEPFKFKILFWFIKPRNDWTEEKRETKEQSKWRNSYRTLLSKTVCNNIKVDGSNIFLVFRKKGKSKLKARIQDRKNLDGATRLFHSKKGPRQLWTDIVWAPAFFLSFSTTERSPIISVSTIWWLPFSKRQRVNGLLLVPRTLESR